MSGAQMGNERVVDGFASMGEFLAMGGHGFYVWLAYGVALIVLLFLVLEPSWRRQQVQKRLRAFYRREQLDAQAAEQGRQERSEV